MNRVESLPEISHSLSPGEIIIVQGADGPILQGQKLGLTNSELDHYAQLLTRVKASYNGNSPSFSPTGFDEIQARVRHILESLRLIDALTMIIAVKSGEAVPINNGRDSSELPEHWREAT